MATVLDSLVVTLGLDSKGFKSGVGDAKKGLGDIKKGSEDTGAALDALAGKVASFFALFTAGKGITEFVSDLTQANAQLERLSRNLGVSTTDLSAWGNLVARSGGTVAGFGSTLENLSRQLTEIKVTGSAPILPYLRSLVPPETLRNINSLDGLLTAIGGGLSRIPNRSDAFNIGKMMGLDEGTVNLLLEGDKGLQALLARQKELNPVTQEQTRNALALSKAWFDFKQTTESTGRAVVAFLTPALEKALSWLTRLFEYLNQHKSVLIGIATGITAFVAPAFILAARAAWAFVAPFLAASAPILAVAAAIAAVAASIGLLVDDYNVWKAGGDSFFDWSKWDKLSAAIKNFVKNADFSPVSAAIAVLTENFVGLKDAISAVYKLVTGDFSGAWKDAKSAASHSLPGQAFGSFQNWGKSLGQEKDRQNQAMAYFQSQGWTKEQAAGIVANLKAESNLNPSAVGDNGKALGIAQWHPDRQAEFAKFAGHDIRSSTFEEQLAFIQHELANRESNAAAQLRKARTAGEAGAAVSQYYERPADVVGQARARALSAQQIAATSSMRGAAMAPRSDYVTRNNTTNSAETHIGSIVVQTQATDAYGIANTLPQAIAARNLAYQSDSGMN